MSWFTEIDYLHTHKCPNGHEFHVESLAGDPDNRDAVSCPECDEKAEFVKFQAKQSILLRSTFTQNGYVGVRTSFSDGRTAYMSQAKRTYVEKGKVTNGYDPNLKKEIKRIQERTGFTGSKDI